MIAGTHVMKHNKTSRFERNADEWYVEPVWAVEGLLNVEKFEGLCYDPACGCGTIPKTFDDAGLDCVGSDLRDRGYGFTGRDFLAHDFAEQRYDNIVSNPPFDVIEPWIHKALSITTRKVAILGRLSLLEGQKRRDDLFGLTPFARVWVSSRRMSMPPGGTDVEPKGGAIAFAWFVWEHGYTDAPTVGWF